MHFTRIRDVGMWTVSVLLPSEMEQLDANQFAAINGDDGGEWEPTSAITIGGNGIRVTSLLWCTGVTNLDGNTAIGLNSSQTLTVAATSSFSGPVTFAGSVQFTSTVSGATFQNVYINGLSTFIGLVSVSNSIEATGNISCNGNATLGVDTSKLVYINGTVRAPITLGVGGYIPRRIIRVTSGAQADVSLENIDHVVMAASIPCVLAEYGLKGAIMHVSNTSGGSLDVKNAGSTILKSLPSKAWAEIMRNPDLGDGWEVVKYGTGL